ncbi:hypothetical protein NDA11_005626 [Ustilago hordei]|nr:hypothetical protein NDA11_005626 [Ustilago hordei]
MSGIPPHLPILPAGFGTDSSYPPIPGSTRITASQPKPSRPPAMSPAPILTGSHRPVAPPFATTTTRSVAKGAPPPMATTSICFLLVFS